MIEKIEMDFVKRKKRKGKEKKRKKKFGHPHLGLNPAVPVPFLVPAFLLLQLPRFVTVKRDLVVQETSFELLLIS